MTMISLTFRTSHLRGNWCPNRAVARACSAPELLRGVLV